MTNLELISVSVHARGKALLQDVSLRVDQGQFVALLGPNGAGKTTLLRAALGLLPVTGDVLLDGRPVRDMPGRERAAKLAWLPQQSAAAEPITVLEQVTAARFRFHETHHAAEAGARSALDAAGASQFAARYVNELSGGEAQRVAVAGMIAQETPLLLLDEPANHLDPAQQIELYRLIARLWREGRGVLCITHDVNMLRFVGDAAVRVVGLADGRVRFDCEYGSPELAGHVGELFNVGIEIVQAGADRLLVPTGGPA
jgi:iron complex transport system ATP-binding protein